MLGDNSRWRGTATILSYDRFGQPSRQPWLDRIRNLTDIDLTNASQYAVKEGDTWYNIASRAYGDPTLFWVIVAANGIVDPFTRLRPGTNLFLPDRNVVFFNVLDFPTGNVKEGPL